MKRTYNFDRLTESEKVQLAVLDTRISPYAIKNPRLVDLKKGVDFFEYRVDPYFIKTRPLGEILKKAGIDVSVSKFKDTLHFSGAQWENFIQGIRQASVAADKVLSKSMPEMDWKVARGGLEGFPKNESVDLNLLAEVLKARGFWIYCYQHCVSDKHIKVCFRLPLMKKREEFNELVANVNKKVIALTDKESIETYAEKIWRVHSETGQTVRGVYNTIPLVADKTMKSYKQLIAAYNRCLYRRQNKLTGKLSRATRKSRQYVRT
ncbi:MAG: hypothetical protein LBU87_06010 [Lactobacillales bacterium]|nr:hypothetical protein [Lactobacillales bacterium]